MSGDQSLKLEQNQTKSNYPTHMNHLKTVSFNKYQEVILVYTLYTLCVFSSARSFRLVVFSLSPYASLRSIFSSRFFFLFVFLDTQKQKLAKLEKNKRQSKHQSCANEY